MIERLSDATRQRVGITIILAVCYTILGFLAIRQHPAPPFAAFMPTDLWVVDSTEIPAARVWTAAVFVIYVAIGVVSFVRVSVHLAAIVPLAMAASIPFGMLRFASAMRAFN